MSFSIIQVLVTALVSAVVSAAVTALISWWRRPIARWAVIADATLLRVTDAPFSPDEPVYFRFTVHNVGDADAYGVRVAIGQREKLKLVPVIRAGESLLQETKFDFDNPVRMGELATTTIEISYFQAPVWRSRPKSYRVPLAQLESQSFVLSDAHPPRFVLWLQSSWQALRG